jgi:acetyl-CoA carboxylase biotin carboxyl carrier protein
MDYKELKEFIKSVAKSGVSEVDIKTDEMKLTIKVSSRGDNAVTHTETVIQQIPYPATMASQQMMQPLFQQQTSQPNFQNNVTSEQPKKEADESSKYVTIKAPMVGTFYRKPGPDKDNYVNVGDVVKTDTVVCIIEAMKLFNEIEAEQSGKIVKILVEDASPVEFDQPLYLVDPS